MKYSLLIAALLSSSLLVSAEIVEAVDAEIYQPTAVLTEYDSAAQQAPSNTTNKPPVCGQELLTLDSCVRINVVGQGVAPMNTSSPAQAYALAKRAAIADSYRLIAEKVKGVRIDGQDTIKNMMITRSTVRTSVCAVVKNANIVETTFKEGLCEVEMEILIYHSQFAQ